MSGVGVTKVSDHSRPFPSGCLPVSAHPTPWVLTTHLVLPPSSGLRHRTVEPPGRGRLRRRPVPVRPGPRPRPDPLPTGPLVFLEGSRRRQWSKRTVRTPSLPRVVRRRPTVFPYHGLRVTPTLGPVSVEGRRPRVRSGRVQPVRPGSLRGPETSVPVFTYASRSAQGTPGRGKTTETHMVSGSLPLSPCRRQTTTQCPSLSEYRSGGLPVRVSFLTEDTTQGRDRTGSVGDWWSSVRTEVSSVSRVTRCTWGRPWCTVYSRRQSEVGVTDARRGGTE